MKVIFSHWSKFKMYTRILIPSVCIAFVIIKTSFSVKILTDNTGGIGATTKTLPISITSNSNGTSTNIFQSKEKVFKKLLVPRGSSLTLTAQVSKPKILPGFFFDDDGIILDAVIELPIWLDIDRFVDAMYNNPEVPDEKGNKRQSFAGKERCILYQQFESFVSSTLPVPPKLPKACLLRAICEIQSLVNYYETQPHSLLIEMLHVILSPSSGSNEECNSAYTKAESMGKYGYCVKYSIDCPIDIASLIISHFNNPFS